MAPQKETIMVLKVDLDCPRCYKKVKKLLCQFPQIHDQVYNEKQNTVMVKVFCCTPEKIRDRLCCKGGKSIKSIEILEPKKPAPKKEEAPPPPPPEPAPAPPPPADPKPPGKMEKSGSKNGSPKPDPPPAEAPPPKPKDPEPDPPPAPKQAEPAPVPVQVTIPQADPVQCYPVYPVNVCCWECYEDQNYTGPCFHGYGYGVPPPPPPAGWEYYGGGCPPPPPPGGYGGYNNYKPGYCVSRCGDYISDENPAACAIM